MTESRHGRKRHTHTVSITDSSQSSIVSDLYFPRQGSVSACLRVLHNKEPCMEVYSLKYRVCMLWPHTIHTAICSSYMLNPVLILNAYVDEWGNGVKPHLFVSFMIVTLVLLQVEIWRRTDSLTCAHPHTASSVYVKLQQYEAHTVALQFSEQLWLPLCIVSLQSYLNQVQKAERNVQWANDTNRLDTRY